MPEICLRYDTDIPEICPQLSQDYCVQNGINSTLCSLCSTGSGPAILHNHHVLQLLQFKIRGGGFFFYPCEKTAPCRISVLNFAMNHFYCYDRHDRHFFIHGNFVRKILRDNTCNFSMQFYNKACNFKPICHHHSQTIHNQIMKSETKRRLLKLLTPTKFSFDNNFSIVLSSVIEGLIF